MVLKEPAHSPVCAVVKMNRGLTFPWGELTALALQFWGGIFLFSSGSLAPALHRGPGLISYLL